MTSRCELTRRIGIDVGHRVPDHGSKCRNPHGHRYEILATCVGPVMDQKGHQENGMVIDFGNIKKYMMDLLDAAFDHGFVVYSGDAAMMNMYFPGRDHLAVAETYRQSWNTAIQEYLQAISSGEKTNPIVLPRTLHSEQDPNGLKIIVVDYVPTAENLAHHMFTMLRQPIRAHYGSDVIDLKHIVLYETPNGSVQIGE